LDILDRVLGLILAALAVTLLLFFAGVTPYPFGILVLAALAVARFLAVRGGPG